MRLLACGGVRYGERARLGAWPALPEGDLGDVSHLSLDGELAFGFGVVGGPCLVLRQRQSTADRGGYAYTLLLDPGEPLWVAARWNAAHLVDAVLDDPVLRDLALHAPERLTGDPDKFTGTLDTSLRQRAHPAPGPAAFAEWVAGCALDGMRVAVGADVLGGSGWPSAATVARWIESLPVCLRGTGWLIGGCAPGSADVFGAALLVSREGTLASGAGVASDQLPVRGRQALTAIVRIDGDRRLAAATRVLVSIPDWIECGRPSAIVRQLVALDAVAHADAAPEPDRAGLVQEVMGMAPLGPTIRDLLREHLSTRPAPWADDAWSRLAVSAWLDHGLALDTALQRTIPPAALVAWIDARGMAPDDLCSGRGADLSKEQWLAIWDAHVARAADDGERLGRLQQAEQVLSSDREVVAALARAMAERDVSAGVSLLPWAALPASSSLAGAAPVLNAASRARVLASPSTRAAEYLAFGDDPGGAWLADADAAVILGVTGAAITLAPGTDAVAVSARTWLEAAAATATRARLPIDTRLAIADLVGGRWESLRGLRDAWLGIGRPRPPANPPLTADEWMQVVRQVPAPETAALDLAVLVSYLDRLPAEEVLEVPAHARRALLPPVVASNLAWLRAHGFTALATAFLGKAWTSRGRVRPELMQAIRPADVAALVASLTTAGDPEDDPRLAERLGSLLERDDALGAAARRAFVEQAGTAGDASSPALFRRVAADPTAFENGLACLAEQVRVPFVARGAIVYPARFVEAAVIVIRRARVGITACSFDAVHAHLSAAEGAASLDALATALRVSPAALYRELARMAGGRVIDATTRGQVTWWKRFWNGGPSA